jgi:hypothetical protein
MSEESGGPPTPVRATIVVAAIASLAFIGFAQVTVFAGAMGGEKVTAPKSYEKYVARDKAFACLKPAGWEMADSALGGTQSSVEFSKGLASVEVDSDLSGSLIGDIARAGGAGLGDLEGKIPGVQLKAPKPPVEVLHDAGKKSAEEEYDEYAEQPMKTLQTKIGEGRFSEFTGKAGGWLAVKVHGYRVTILGGERSVAITAKCRDADWTALKPAFEKVITSIEPGGA